MPDETVPAENRLPRASLPPLGDETDGQLFLITDETTEAGLHPAYRCVMENGICRLYRAHPWDAAA